MAARKTEDVLSWQDYFMSLAFLSGQRSKDPRTQTGACIVNDRNRIVGLGYNGMPDGCHDEKMSWERSEKKPYVVHAELNAVLNANGVDLHGHRIYVSLFPCFHCAQVIVQSGITKVFYCSDKYHVRDEYAASRKILTEAKVAYEQYVPTRKEVTIKFDSINSTEGPTTTEKPTD